MPRHDLPDGHEADGNLVDFTAHLRRRTDRSSREERAASEADAADDYGRAEHGDGRRPRFGRFDLLWIGMILVIGYVFWTILHR